MEFIALLTLAGIVLNVGVACSVFGVVICRWFRWRWILQHGPGLNAVVGLAAALLFLEVWNFFCPINHASVWALFLFILGSAILLRRTVIGVFGAWIRNSGPMVGLSLVFLLLTVSWFGLGPSEHGHYDTGLYYLNTIRWSENYPVVPGLANLHSRLGFNQSFFLFVAFLARLMNLGLARACQVVNPIVVFISGWAIIDRLKMNLSGPTAKQSRRYSTLLLCPLFFLASHMWISAPTSDLAAAALALPSALAFFCCLEEIFHRNAFGASNWFLVMTITATTVTKLKLSYLVLGGIAIGLAAVAFIFIQRREFWRLWMRTGILAVVIMVPWGARGVVLSGYPFYPATFLRFRTDWALPRKRADSDRDWIYSWAKWPDKDPRDVLYSDAWFGPWIARNAQKPENVFLFLFAAAGLFSLLVSLAIPMGSEQRMLTILLMLPAALALVFWFKTAPDPRFGYATILLFGVNGLNATAAAISAFSPTRVAFYTCGAALASVWLIFTNEWPLISLYQKKFPQGFPRAALVYETTKSGLRVGIAHYQAWDSALVVTPEFNPALTLRGSRLSDGFRMEKQSDLDAKFRKMNKSNAP